MKGKNPNWNLVKSGFLGLVKWICLVLALRNSSSDRSASVDWQLAKVGMRPRCGLSGLKTKKKMFENDGWNDGSMYETGLEYSNVCLFSMMTTMTIISMIPLFFNGFTLLLAYRNEVPWSKQWNQNRRYKTEIHFKMNSNDPFSTWFDRIMLVGVFH